MRQVSIEPQRAAATGGIAVRNVRTIADLEKAALAKRTGAERISDLITRWAGSPLSIALHILWFAGWITLNSGLTEFPPFDPYPFGFMTVIVSLEAIFLSLFILKSQNTMQRHADARAHLDLQINLLAEEESTKTLMLVQSLCAHFGIAECHDTEIEDLIENTDPSRLAESLKVNLPPE